MMNKSSLIDKNNKNIITDDTQFINKIINPNIITTQELLNPSLFIYNNIYLIDILNSNNLYPINIKTNILNTIEKRKIFVDNIVELYGHLIAICNYCIDKGIKNDLIMDIKNIFLEFKSINWAFYHTDDDKKNYNDFILKLDNNIKSIYNKTFLIDNLNKPIDIIKNNIYNLKTLNKDGSNDEINLCNFIINIYENIIILSYHIINNDIDYKLMFNNLINNNFEFITSLSYEYQFLHYNLFMMNLSYKKKYITISNIPKLDLIDKINLLIKNRLNLLIKSLPTINDKLTNYNNNIIIYISLIENNYYLNNNSLNLNNFPLNQIFNECKYLLKSYINEIIKENNTNTLIISNIYKCILQLIIEAEYLYIKIDDNKKFIEGYSKKKVSLCRIIITFLFIFMIIYLIIKKNYK